MKLRLLLFSLLLALAGSLHAQPAPIDGAERDALIDRVATLLQENYVFEDLGIEAGAHARAEAAAGAFDDATDPEAFADRLTDVLQSITRDKHMRVRFRPPMRGDGPRDPAAERARMRQQMRAENYGFARVEILDGNIGYLDLRQFAPPQLAEATAVAAMRFLENTDAVIFDLRRNGGGNPRMVQLITSYFFDEPTHLNSLYWRRGDRTDEFWTHKTVEGVQRPDVPLYVLTSEYTFSAAEEFTYNLKTRERATVVGETTGGGANPGGGFPLNDRFMMFIPTGRAINPVTGTNWEGTGIAPDIEAPADAALDAALEHARAAAEAYRAKRAQHESALHAEIRRALEEAEQHAAHDAEATRAAVGAALSRARAAGLHDEMTINRLGYDYLGQGKHAMAIAVFGYNVEAFPESSNVYDSLGEAYMEAGERDKAIANYKKSLALDPGNDNAVRMLKRLGVE